MIGIYLLCTRNKGLAINPTRALKIDDYPKTYFAGLCGCEDSSDRTVSIHEDNVGYIALANKLPP